MVSGFDLNAYLREMHESGYTIEDISPFFQASLQYVFETNIQAKNAQIVDIGTAIGHVPAVLKHSGFGNISCVDGTDLFRENLEKSGYSFFTVDLEQEDLPFADASVDCCTCFEVIEHIERPTNMLTEILRVLKPGGKLILTTPDLRRVQEYFYEDPTHVRPFIKEGLARTLRTAGFSLMEIKNWGGRFKVHKMPFIYRNFPQCFFLGTHLIAICEKY